MNEILLKKFNDDDPWFQLSNAFFYQLINTCFFFSVMKCDKSPKQRKLTCKK